MNLLKANQNQNGGAKVSVLLVIFGVFWCSLVGVFDVFIFRSVAQQIGSTWFQPTGARILKSEVTTHCGDDGPTHGVNVEYAYSVNGMDYKGTRYTFDGSSSSDSRWAWEVVAAYPAGAERICYYDPQNPARAVLAPGLHGSDVTHLMFITPFNIVAGFFIAYPIWMWRDRKRPAMLEPRFADRALGRESYALNQFNPLVTFFGLFLLTSFIGIFVVVFTGGGFHPSMTKVVTVWGAGFAIAVGISVWVHLKTKSGRYDLVFDRNSQTITVPAFKKRKTIEMVAMADVEKFDVQKVESGSGDDRTVTWQVKMLADGGHELLLQESYLEPQAKRLAETLNAKLKA